MYRLKPFWDWERDCTGRDVRWRAHLRVCRKARRSALDGVEVAWVRLPARRHDPRHPRGLLVGSSRERPRFRAYLGVERAVSPDGAVEVEQGFVEVLSGIPRRLRDEVEEDLDARLELSKGLAPLVEDAQGRLLFSFENSAVFMLD